MYVIGAKRGENAYIGSYDCFYFCFSLVEKVARGFANQSQSDEGKTKVNA